jgi:SET domain-containing protein
MISTTSSTTNETFVKEKVTTTATSKKVSFKTTTTATPKPLLELSQKLPNGIVIGNTSYGFGLFATKFFPKDSILYTGAYYLTPDADLTIKLYIEDSGETYYISSIIHGYKVGLNERQVCLFDSYMNHSCDPTSITKLQTPNQIKARNYCQIALKDIQPGDQITCDYNLFEYECTEKQITNCQCGASNCVKEILGFKHLPLIERKKKINLVESSVLQAITSDPANRFLYIEDLKCPIDRVEVIQTGSQDNYKLIAKQIFEQGDVIFSNESLIFPEDHAIVIELLEHRKWLDRIHTNYRGDGQREFYYFDTFQNHSCDPNTVMKYHTENRYDLVAIKKIAIGDELTSDYETFDCGTVTEEDYFTCRCGAATCRGQIRA